MAARKKSVRKVSVDAQVEVSRVPFVRSSGLRYLDLERLERAKSAVVELGRFESECCDRVMRAEVRRGLITRIEVDPCHDSGKGLPAAEMAMLLKRAGLKPPRGGPKLPVPIAHVLEPRDPTGPIIDVKDWWYCERICVVIWNTTICFTCCTVTSPGGGTRRTCS